jgi:predicted amidohydrolase YtcJ
MTTTARIPLLKDHHTHPFLYASLADCPDISLLRHKNHALGLIEESCRKERLTVVTGWNDSSFTFSTKELNSFPPLVILNSSLHFLVIDQVVAAVSRLERRPQQIRMEHCQFISRETAHKAKRLEIVLCMQPNFSAESIFYRDRLPEACLRANNPFRMLIDDAGYLPGKDLLLGSDGMPHGVRQALENALFPPLPSQRLSLEEFVAGYCMPDFTNGFIDIEIDHERRRVTTRVMNLPARIRAPGTLSA